MRKNIYGAIVIIFVVFACILVMSEINTPTNAEMDTLQYYAGSE
ncbi:hypothetical protein [Bizionia arctica]|nr:hypothetical protein [Bizionia arctica]